MGDLMSSLDQNQFHEAENSRRGPRWRLWAILLAMAFLLGFVPMWMKGRQRTRERDEAQSALRISTLQLTLANAAIDTQRSQYEPARKAASEFYTKLQAEIDRGDGSVFGEAQRNSLRAIVDRRDETITLLARSDPAALARLSDLYARYRQATSPSPVR